jgi:hypothetical protein
MEYFNQLKYGISGQIKDGIGALKNVYDKALLIKKLSDATSDEHCHANISLLNEISERTFNL